MLFLINTIGFSQERVDEVIPNFTKVSGDFNKTTFWTKDDYEGKWYGLTNRDKDGKNYTITNDGKEDNSKFFQKYRNVNGGGISLLFKKMNFKLIEINSKKYYVLFIYNSSVSFECYVFNEIEYNNLIKLKDADICFVCSGNDCNLKIFREIQINQKIDEERAQKSLPPLNNIEAILKIKKVDDNTLRFLFINNPPTGSYYDRTKEEKDYHDNFFQNIKKSQETEFFKSNYFEAKITDFNKMLNL